MTHGHDIIRPSYRMGDAVFTELYADRKARKEVKPTAKVVRSQGRRHDSAFRDTFCRLYRSGMKAAHIAAEMDVARNSVWRFAKFYGLPQRHETGPRMGRQGGIAVTTRVNDAMDREITAFCRARNISRAAWLRKLIRNNLDSRS